MAGIVDRLQITASLLMAANLAALIARLAQPQHQRPSLKLDQSPLGREQLMEHAALQMEVRCVVHGPREIAAPCTASGKKSTALSNSKLTPL